MAYGVWASAAICWHDIVRGNLRNVQFHGADGTIVPSSAYLIFSYLMGTRVEILMVGMICVVMGIIVIAFTGYHLWLMGTNKTTNETFKWSDLQDARDAFAKRLGHFEKAAVAAEARRDKAKAQGDSEAAAAAQTEIDDIRHPRGPDGVRKSLPPPPGRMPGNFYDKGFLANCSEVLWPLSLRRDALITTKKS